LSRGEAILSYRKLIKSQEIEEYMLDVRTLETWLWDRACSISEGKRWRKLIKFLRIG
jgi:hypothetical protein